MGRVVGKIALVSGAASGIGAACARLLAAEGAKVMLVDLNDEMATRVLTEIRATGGEAEYHHLDVTSEPGWEAVMAAMEARFGGLNIAVNCAGTSVSKLTFPTETGLDEWRRIVGINLEGTFLATKHQLALMMRTSPVFGSIINISSVLGIVGQPGIASYNASKGGVRLYSKSVALSCAQDQVNVRVNTIHPGFIRTPLLEQSIARFGDAEEGRKFYDNLQPIGHLGEPEDIANGALYLASDESRFVTGAELVIDGGFTAR
jgi:NAD(P)-dependent dehydrogenase (short-subunit alcohol dehydrogenase family)